MSEAPQIGLPGIEAQRGAVDSDACFTPPDIIEGVTAALGGAIETDPCWHPDSFVPDYQIRYDGRERGDGLSRGWSGTLWMNPPYSNPLPWAKRFKRHAEKAEPSIALVKLDPTTEAWRTLTSNVCMVGLLRKRVPFLGAFAGGGTPNMVVAFVACSIERLDLVTCLPMAEWWQR